MITTSARRTLVALITTAAFLPAAPALAQTAPQPPPTTAPAPSLTDLSVSRAVIDFGQTVDVTVRGTAGYLVGLYGTAGGRPARLIRTGTIDDGGSVVFAGLQPGDTTAFAADVGPRNLGTTTPRPNVRTAPVVVRVRRTVTIGVAQPTRGSYVFSGQIQPRPIERAEAPVQVTIARLDGETNRVIGVASTRTTPEGRYEIRTSLPQGLAGYYALTEAQNNLDAGRSRLYGLLVNTRPGAAAPTSQGAAAASTTLGVRYKGTQRDVYTFSGRLTPGRSVPVTLARVVGGRLVGVAGGRTSANGSYSFNLRLPAVPEGPQRLTFQVLTAAGQGVGAAVSSPYGLVIPQLNEVFYANCAEARAAGVTPLRVGEQGYSLDLDGDGDGVACE